MNTAPIHEPLLRVTFEDGRSIQCRLGETVGALAPPPADPQLPFLAALVNNDLVSLTYPLTVHSTVRFLTLEDPHGWRVYRRSLCFLLAMAMRDADPAAEFSVEHSFGLGLYCSYRPDGRGARPDEVGAIERRMRELVAAALPIVRCKAGYAEAVRTFAEAGQEDELNLLRHRNPPHVVMHCCGTFSDLAHGPLAPSTATLSLFRLLPYPPGFVLHLPDRSDPLTLPPFEDQPHLFQIFQEHKEWGRILGVNTAGRLNGIIASGGFEEFVRTAEALHEKKLSRIADAVAAARERVRLVLVAGPSASGKTTFAKRLTTHLAVNGLRPVTLSTDDYFVGFERNPLDEEGRPDYEHIEAVDLDLFNRHLLDLIEGREVPAPRFNFSLKRREDNGRRLRLEPDQVLIIEGIHGLNPRLTASVPAAQKFRIYVSALTQLSLDRHNRVSTTDDRLLRRLVRDHRFRGHAALETLRLWPAVRRGERLWIFPFQREADATFNSALDYELAVLKPLAEPLLAEVKPSDPEYAESRRLSEFLLNFLAAPDRAVPGVSILREYIGRSTLRY
jgi:uridine kinase